jgi:hypothetical protein
MGSIHHLPAAQTMRFGEFAYESFVTQHRTPAFGETRLGALTRKNVEDYLVRKIETPRTPQKTRKKDAKGSATI